MIKSLLIIILLSSHVVSKTFNIFVDKNQLMEGEVLTLSVQSFDNDEFPKVFLDEVYGDFDVLSGPSQQTNIQWVNGKMNNTKTLSWKLVPKRSGTLFIPAIKVLLDNDTFFGEEIKIVVGNNSYTDNNKIFIVADIDKNEAYPGEQITLSYNLYKSPDVKIAGIDQFKIPEFKGFWVEEIFTPQRLQYNSKLVNINGVSYQVANLGQRALFPMLSKTHKIPSVSVKVQIEVEKKRRRRDPFFDPFFDSFFSETKTRLLNSKEKNITLKRYPEPIPKDFTGAVGDFSIKAIVDTNITKQNDAITYKIQLFGTGNIGLFQIPKVEFPKTIEVFTPDEIVEKDDFRDKMTGEQIWEYILIPRETGKISLPPISMSYFSPASANWVRISTKSLILSVERDDKNLSSNFGIGKKEIELLNKDIRFIRNDIPNFKKMGDSGKNTNIMIYSISIFMLILPKLLAKYSGYRLDTEGGRRMRNAYKKSLKILRQNNSMDHFETANDALHLYLVDRFNLQEKVLDKTSIELLLDNKISSGLKEKLLEIIETFNEARFSQSSNVNGIDPIREMEELLMSIDKELK